MDEFGACVGLEVHKESISVAIAQRDRDGEARRFGTVPDTPEAAARLARELADRHRSVESAHEAGPCGYTLYRQLAGMGLACRVVAPAQIREKAGDRTKNDTRDAIALARLLRAGELTFVWVPDEGHETMRDLVRARRTAADDVRQVRAHIQMFLLRLGQRYPGVRSRGAQHRRRLAGRSFGQPARQFALQSYVDRLEQAESRKAELEAEIAALLPGWSMAPVVHAVQALEGVGLAVAATLVAEVGDLGRFASPRQLMAYLGVVPGEHSSGGSIRPRGITKAGSSTARTLLFEAAWAYRLPAKVGREGWLRQRGMEQWLRDLSWRAEVRLSARYRRLVARGKRSNVAITAVARELVGFVWAIATRVRTAPAATA